jgi:hypothetical protein
VTPLKANGMRTDTLATLFFRDGRVFPACLPRVWGHIIVGELVAMPLGSLAEMVGPRPLKFAEIVGSNQPWFASPCAAVCRPLQLAAA